MKKILLFFVSLFSAGLVSAQQIGNGYAQTINSFNSVLNTGIYDSDKAQINYPYEVPHWPWKYLFVMRHNNLGLNYQFQISSTFEHNDRVFFRKLCHLNTDTIYNNEWYEFATRWMNTFTGQQNFQENLYISRGKGITFGHETDTDRSLQISYIGDDQRGDSYINYSQHLFFVNGNKNNGYPVVVFKDSGDIGIGTLDPRNKLDVNGTIRAKEIKVESNWADFVFRKGYKLPALEEVKKHIEEKGTLPGVPNESDVKVNGVNLGEVNALLLQKIEELTLYTIEQQDIIENMKNEIDELKHQFNSLKYREIDMPEFK